MDNVYFYQVENQQEQDILNLQEDEFRGVQAGAGQHQALHPFLLKEV